MTVIGKILKKMTKIQVVPIMMASASESPFGERLLVSQFTKIPQHSA